MSAVGLVLAPELMSRIARDCVWEGLVAHLDAGVTRGRRALGDESETLVRLLAGAQRVISKNLGDSRFSNAAVSREDPRRPLFTGCGSSQGTGSDCHLACGMT